MVDKRLSFLYDGVERKDVHLLDHNNSSNRGRPSLGLEAKDSVCKVRLDAFTHQRVIHHARVLGITKAELIRQGILLYLEQMENTYPELKYR